MKFKHIYTSLTRITDLQEKKFYIKRINKKYWATGDYVVCKIIKKGSDTFKIELPTGRMRGIMGGETLVGVLGERYATLEATGTWRATGNNGRMQVLTAGGLFGKLTSKSVYIHEMTTIEYTGHVYRNNKKLIMDNFIKPTLQMELKIPIILLFGTSMSAGKTTSARIVTNIFKIAGLKVVGAKFSGAGRYKDILAIKDVGADAVFDFVDAGLPSSICKKEVYRKKVKHLKNLLANTNADVGVVEIGASPLEPYNGELAIEAIRKNIKCVILCASDPYAVYGIINAFGIKPDIVTGVSTNTLAGRDLVEKLCNVTALNLIDPKTTPMLKHILSNSLGFNL